MTMTELTPFDALDAAAKRMEAIDQTVTAKGAAATEDERNEHDAAYKGLLEATERFQRSTTLDNARQILSGEQVGGESFDELAAKAGTINPQGMTIGEAFTKSAAFEDVVSSTIGPDGQLRAGVKSRNVDFAVGLHSLRNDLKFAEGDDVATKALVTGASATSGGALIEPDRLPGVADRAPFQQRRIWDLCTKVPVSGDTMEYVEITSKTNNAAEVAEATSTGVLTSSYPTDGTATDAAGGLKPESALAMAVESVLIETIAHWVPFTRRVAADAPQLATIIDQFLVGGINSRAENQMILGNGTSPNLRGILNSTNAYSINSVDVSDESATRLDAIALAVAQIMSAMEEVVEPNAVVMHPLDWMTTDFALAKDSNGQYLGAGPFASLDSLRQLWGYRVVLSKAVPQGTQLVGDFRQALIGDRQQAAIYMTDSHADWFPRNILVALGEARMGFGLRIPEAFCSVVA